jgi:bifunctional DNA-binding transcriptional regulator/antitoxin component of YhaV-PrlF toxin-antitoxin module
MVIPAQARKKARIGQGDVVSVQPEGDGRILLIRLERPKPVAKSRAKLVKRNGRHSLIVGGPKIGVERILQVMRDEYP